MIRRWQGVNNWAIEYTKTLAPGFFIRQVAVIMVLFAIGLLIVCALAGTFKESALKEPVLKKSALKEPAFMGVSFGHLAGRFILSFPIGLSAFILAGYILLLLGIPYTALSVSVLMLLISAAAAYFSIRKGTFCELFTKDALKWTILAIIAVIALACFAASGIMPLSISNDSMYYFHEYPKDIVYFGVLRDQFDTFLTDTGLGSVVIETLPFLFGFNESFGIREFMHINFLIYFVYRSYILIFPVVCRHMLPLQPFADDITDNTPGRTGFLGKDEKKASALTLAAAFILGVLLAAASPVWILGHWAMANMYFMEFFFMAALEAYYCKRDGNAVLLVALLSVSCSLLRIEGGVFMLLLTVCFTFLDYSGKELALDILGPMLILTGGYGLKIFTSYTIDNPYTFLTPAKSALEAAAMTALIIYVIFVKNHLSEHFKRLMPFALTAGLILLNLLLLVRNSSLYMANLRAFYGNLMGQSGWGMMPHFLMAALIVLAVLYIRKIYDKSNKADSRAADSAIDNGAADNKKTSDGTMSLALYLCILSAGFVLMTIAASYMRGDPLNVQVGDSGNRVLMQIAPLLVITVVSLFTKVLDSDE